MRQSERGFALIFVFAMAAAMAILLYLELPRLALELQRNREEALIERGESYVRAIQVYQRKNKKLPQTIEELETTNGLHFLRKRYVDPMTGKDDWRIIHSDGTKLTDSLVTKAGIPGLNDQKAVNNFITEGPTIGSTTDPNAPAPGQARRASEMQGAPGAPPPPGQLSPYDPNNPNNFNQNASNQGPGPGSYPGAPPNYQQYPPGHPLYQQQQQQLQQGLQPGPQGQLIGPNGQPIVPVRIPGLPGQQGVNANVPPGTQPGGGQPAANYSYGSGYSGVGGYQSNGPQPTPYQPGQQPGPQPGFGSGSNSFTPVNPNAPQSPSGINVNPAAALIQQMLTRPNPQGLQNAIGANQGQTLSAGIAGIASKKDAEGIKIYKEKTNYKLWEFVYDPTKQKNGQPLPGLQGQGQPIPGQQFPGGNAGQNGFGQGGFGQQPMPRPLQ